MTKNGSGRLIKCDSEQLARGLGWFSIGLGLAEVMIPSRVAGLVGVSSRHTFIIRLLGLREIASGIGILTQRRPSGWMWARVGGDAIDLALLGASMTGQYPKRSRLTAATAAVAGVTALDFFCGQELCREPKAGGDGAVHVETSLIINESAEELYRHWRDFQNLPKFMTHLKSVQVLSPTRSHWVAQGPAGSAVEWDAEIISDKPHELISWRSLEGADVDNAGAVRFERAPGGRGTLVRVKMQYRTPGGKAGALVAKLLGQVPEKQVKVDLLRFKQFVETGEIARTDGQPAGRSRSTSRKYDDLVRH